MKKFTFVLMTAVASLAFVNCSSDDDGGNDCFSCGSGASEIKYCKKGDDKYTVTVGGVVTQEFSLDGESWEDFRADMQELCD